jgi:uncharacterized protein
LIQVVLDTNTIISSIFWGGIPGRVYKAAVDERYALLTSHAMLAELLDVLQRPKFAPFYKATGRLPEVIFERHREVAKPADSVEIPTTAIRDQKDRIVLGCALGGQADYIVSGDKDLLTLGEYVSVKIVTAVDFLAILESS